MCIYLEDLLHEGLLLKSDHIVHKVEQCNEPLGREVSLGRKVEKETLNSISHIYRVNGLNKIFLVLRSTLSSLLIILILLLKIIIRLPTYQ